MAPIQKPHPPTTPGAIYYTHGYTIGDEEIALLQTIMAVQKKAVEYLDSNEPNSDPRLRLVASRVAQWLPESIEHEQETPKAAVCVSQPTARPSTNKPAAGGLQSSSTTSGSACAAPVLVFVY